MSQTPALGALAVTLALALSGCGGSARVVTVTVAQPTTTSATPVTTTESRSPTQTQRGYLGTASNGEIFIQWTRTGTSVTGTLSEAYIDPSSPTQMQSASNPFTGVVSGSSVTLSVNGVNWTGSLNGSSLTLSTTLASGTISSYVLHPATVADYNVVVAAVQDMANTALAASDVEGGISDLQSDVTTAGNYLGSLNGDLANVRGDVQDTYQQLEATRTDTPDDICGDASDVSGDASDTSNDVSDDVSVDVNGFDSDAQQATSAVSQLSSDAATLRHGIASTGYTPSGAPSPATVASAISAARASLAHDRIVVAGDVKTANQLLATANGYASQAQTVCNQRGQ